jgi:hypothetical protein
MDSHRDLILGQFTRSEPAHLLEAAVPRIADHDVAHPGARRFIWAKPPGLPNDSEIVKGLKQQ